jgi:hypothetical protein
MPITGDIVTAQSYNDLQTAIYNILGNGSGQSGYGKSLVSSPVNIGDDITAANWASLKVDILTVAYHQGLSLGDLPTPGSAGDFFINAADLGILQLAVAQITTNKFLLGAGQYSDENLLNVANQPISNSRTASWGGPANQTVTHAFTVTFNTAAAARYFFNAGSSLRLTAAFTGSYYTRQNHAWSRLLNNIGVVIFDHSSTSAGGGTGSSIGFYNLTSTPQTVFIASGAGVYGVSGPYSTNDYIVQMSCNVANNSSGGATQISVVITFNDFHTDAYSDSVDGTLSSNVSIRRASGQYVSEAAPVGANHILLNGTTL